MANNKKADGKTLEAWCEQSHKYLRAGDYLKALEAAEKALTIDPQSPLALTRRGNAKAGMEDYDAAIADHTVAIDIDPEFEIAYNSRGVAKHKQGDDEGAVIDYDEAIRLNPDFYKPYYNRGIVKSEQGDNEEAITDYTKAIRLKPDHADAYNNRGVVKSEQGDNEEAIADYTKAIRLKPNHAEAYYNRGGTKSEQGDDEGAIADYTEAIRLKPDHAKASYNRGNKKFIQGDYEGAIADYERFLELVGDSEHLLQRAYAEKKIKELSDQNKRKEKPNTGAVEPKEKPPEELKLATEMRAVIVVDIVGSTKMLAEKGVDHFLEHVLYKLLAKSKFVAGDGVKVIKHTGDGLMMVAKTVDAALNASIELVEFAEGEKFDIRVGIDYGKVKVDRNNQLGEGTEDVFGEPVIAAVRLEGITVENGNLINPDKKDQDIDDLDSAITEGRNRILMTYPTREQANPDLRNNCCYVGHYNLKGLKHRRPIYAVNWKEIQK